MLSSIFILNASGDVMIDMQFRGKVPRATLEGFWSAHMAPLLSFVEVPSAVRYGDHTFYQIQRNRVFLVAATSTSTSATVDRSGGDGSCLVILETLSLVARILTAYLRELSEQTVRENFSIVYQLLQEVLDYGYPLTTEVFALEELVPKPTLESKVMSLLDNSNNSTATSGSILDPIAALVGVSSSTATSASPLRPPLGASINNMRHNTTNNTHSNNNNHPVALGYSGGTPWRDPRTRHATNEILFDVIESLDCIMDANGKVLKASVRGAVEVNCKLSGMPDVLLRLTNSEPIDDIAFHRCVRAQRYNNDETISFVPPDGKFTLLEYICVPPRRPDPPPFYVTPQVSFNASGGRFSCMMGMRGGGAGYHNRHHQDVQERSVQGVVVQLILPPNTASLTVSTCTAGTTRYERSSGALMWNVNTIGRDPLSLSGDFVFESSHHDTDNNNNNDSTGGTGAVAGATAIVAFRIPNYSVSGVRVDSVQVLNEISKPYKGIKYMAQAGNFIVRAV